MLIKKSLVQTLLTTTCLNLLLLSSGASLCHATDSAYHEEAKKITRARFEQSIEEIRGELYTQRLPLFHERFNHAKPNIFISYAWEDDIKPWVDQILSKDLGRLGFEVLYDQKGIRAGAKISAFEEKVSHTSFVVVLCTPQYLKRYTEHDPQDPSKSTGVGREMTRIIQRLKSESQRDTVLPIYRKGGFGECVPKKLWKIAAFDVNDDTSYYKNFFILAQSFFLFEHNEAEPIRSIRERFLNFDQPQDEKLAKEIKLLTLTPSSSHNAQAKDMQDAEETFILAEGYEKKGNTAKALELYLKAASQNYTLAQVQLENLYVRTTEGFANSERTFLTYQERANKGEPMAEIILGWMYRDGCGTARNDKKALTIFQKYAEQGYANAQFNVAVMYANGRGVAQDNAEALKWLRMAAERGHTVAKAALQNLGITT